MTLYEEDSLSVRTLHVDDYPTLSKWLTNPLLLEFYEGRDNPHDIAKVAEVFGSKQDRSVTGCIVSYDGKDIGYVQFYPVSNTEKAEYGLEIDEIVYGMDQFIGEPNDWNRGIGTRLVKSTVAYLQQSFGTTKVMMDPQAWNTRAIRCYQKSGIPQSEVVTNA